MSEITLIASGKGGVGKSTVSALLGLSLAQNGKKVLIVELDAGLRCLDIMLGVSDHAVFDLSDVAAGRCAPRDAIVCGDFSENLFVAVAPNDPSFRFDNLGLAAFLKKLYGFFDYVLIDAPAGLGDQVKFAASLCNRALIIVTPDSISVRDGAKVSQLLRQQGVARQHLLINKVNTDDPKKNGISDFDRIMDTVGIPLIGVICDDKTHCRALSEGKLSVNRGQIFEIFEAIAKRFLGNRVSLLII